MNGPRKSRDEYILNLFRQLIMCDPLGITPHKSLMKDIETLESRYSHEGLAFLTKTLPKLGKDLDRSVVTGMFSSSAGFKTSHCRNTPAFLQAYFNILFDGSGLLLEEAPAEALKHLRQVLFFAYKLELPYSSELTNAVLNRFKETDEQLPLDFDSEVSDLLDHCARITSVVFDGFDHKDILPRHGPGAVATGEKVEEKWNFSRLYNQIHQVYPYYDYYMVGRGRELLDRRDWYLSLERCESGQAKVILVPKDSRGPRLISAEPLEYQWIQQGLGRKMAHHLEAVSPLTKGHVNFTDQEINRSIALSSSTTKSFATLDLKDASDRVSLAVVRRIFGSVPKLLQGLEATRSSTTLLPNGEVVTLRKYAPMGSALCFPVEAYVFWVTLVASVVRAKHLPLKQVVRSIYVYGDDIIVPTGWADLCIQSLESIGLAVNRDKCCITGSFRESCGMDAFKGISVTPIRLRHQFTWSPQDGTVLSAYASLANHLQGTYPQVSSLIWGMVESTYGKIPYGTSRSSFPCKEVASQDRAISLNAGFLPCRVNRRFQQVEFRVSTISSVRRETSLDGWTRLLRNMVSPPIDEPSKVVRPRSTVIKRGWRAVW